MSAVIVTLSLSVWQLQRGMSAYDRDQKLSHIKKSFLTLNGEWQLAVLLLDNKTQDGAAGYWVFAPFLAETKSLYWIRLGFYATQDREKIVVPVERFFSKKNDSISIKLLDWPDHFVWSHGQNVEKLSDRQYRVQSLNRESLRAIEKKLFRQTLTSNLTLYTLPEAIHGMQTPAVRKPYLKPYTHFGYALQWAGLCLVSFFFMIRFIFPRRKNAAIKPN